MKKKSGFTLIELLAVIIILGVLMLIAVPSVTEYIGNSRKKAYLSTASSYIGAAAYKVNNLDLPINDTDTTYYVPVSFINLEKGGRSPYGEWKEAYVVVTFDGTKYNYYWTSLDEGGNAILLAYGNNLDKDDIVTNVSALDLSIGVGVRTNIVIFAEDGTIADGVTASGTIAENSSLTEGTIVTSTDVSCFEYSVMDEEYLIDWTGYDNIEQVNDGFTEDYNIGVSDLLGNIIITDYNQFMADGTTGCPTDVVIPNKIDNKNVVWLADSSFDGAPSQVSSDGEIGKVQKLNSSIKKMHNYSQKLTSVYLPKSIIFIGYYAFYDNSLTSINIPTNLKYLGIGSFLGNNLTSLFVPGNVKSISMYAFSENQLESLTIQNGVEYIEAEAFYDNSLTSVSIPGSVKKIGNGAFTSNNISSLTLGLGIEEIGSFAFELNILTTVTLPTTLNILCDYAFDETVNILPSTPHWSTGCCGCVN